MPLDPATLGVGALAVFLAGLSKSGLAPSLGAATVPLLIFVLPARDAAGMMLPLLIAMDAVAVYNLRHSVDWANLKIMLPGAMAGIAIGWLTSSIVSDAAIDLAVGLISLAFVLDAWLPLRQKLATGLSRPWGTFWGAVAGLTSFISHTGGPPFQIYVVPQKLAPARFAGTAAWFFAIVNLAKLLPYYALDQLSVSNLELAALFLPAAIIGIFVGLKWVRLIPKTLFYQATYILIFLLGLKLVIDGTSGLLGL